MSDYLGNLAARSLEPAAAVRPRLASRFEPMPSAVPQFQEPAFFEETVEETAVAEPAHATVFSPSPPGPRRTLGQGMRPRRAERPEAEDTPEGRPEAEDTPKAATERREPEQLAVPVQPLVVVDSARPLTRSGLPFEASSPGPFSRGEKGKQEAVTPVVLPVRQEVRVVEAPEVRAAHPTEPVFDTPFPFSPREKGSGDEASEGRPPEPLQPLKKETPSSFLQPRITLPEPAPAREAPAPETVIHVSIGRIEVRATQAPKAPARERPAAARTGVDLEDYLRQRSKGEGR
jgi:hypothetical protein